MPKQYVYTSTLPIELKEELDLYATKHKTSKNKIIEKVLKKFLTEERKKAYAETFKKASSDSEMIEMADWGLEDYLNQLKELEK